jgi:hypothetical protein
MIKRLYVHDACENSTFQTMEAKTFKLYPTLLICDIMNIINEVNVD